MRRIVFRTDEEQADPRLFWLRSDEEFFAAGACHVLAGAFLALHPHAEFSAWSIRPRAPHGRGGHIVVAGEDLVFDWAGYSPRDAFLSEYVDAMRTLFPDWGWDFDKLDMDPIAWDFCRTRNHRHPTQFPHDPIPRATAFIRRFPSPYSVTAAHHAQKSRTNGAAWGYL
jgi:hypothetical protein